MAVRYPGLLVTLEDGTCVRVPDPMHLEGWEDNDEPLATDWHRWDRDHGESMLRARFAGPDCYVSGETWLHMDPLHLDDKLQPDLLGALGVVHTARAGYNPEVEGKPPDLLAEFLSDSSLKADRSDKWPRYARLGVREYFVFNPGGRFRDPRIQGWSLQRDATRAALLVDGVGQTIPRQDAVGAVVGEGGGCAPLSEADPVAHRIVAIRAGEATGHPCTMGTFAENVELLEIAV